MRGICFFLIHELYQVKVPSDENKNKEILSGFYTAAREIVLTSITVDHFCQPTLLAQMAGSRASRFHIACPVTIARILSAPGEA